MTRKRDEFEGKLEQMKRTVADMQGVCKPLAEDLLEAYVRVYQDYRKLDDTLAKDGLLIEMEKGGAGNRHIERVKHPAFDMRRNCINQLGDLANRIKRFVKDDTASEVSDDFSDF